MITAQVFAAWLITTVDIPPIPFNSYQECLAAKQELNTLLRDSASICIHGKKETEEWQ